MALEDRIRASVDLALEELRARLDHEVRAIVQQLLTAAGEEHAEALSAANAQATQALNDSIADAHARERESELAGVTRLLESIRGLDGATSLSEVLDALGQAAGREASRAAVLVVRHERLLGWKLAGFGARDAQPKSVELGLNEGGVIGLAVGSARPVTTRDSSTAAGGPGFAQLPADRTGFAVPVIVGGRVVAVVYADSVTSDGREHTVPSGWPEVIEVLVRHAARCLEALTAQKTAAPPSPRVLSPATGQSHAVSGAAGQSGTPPVKPQSAVAAPPMDADGAPGVPA